MTLTPEQLAIRHTFIGGSEIAAVVGLSKWEGPFGVYRRKVGEAPEKTANAAMEAGNRLEDAVCAWAWDKIRKDFSKDAIIKTSDTVRHPTVPFAACTPDRVIFDFYPAQVPDYNKAGRRIGWSRVVAPSTAEPQHYKAALIQAKNVGLHMGADWGDESADVPIEYQCQLQWEMMVTDIHRGYMAVLIGGQDHRVYPFAYDPELGEMLLAKATAFWNNHVVPRIPPPVDRFEETSAYLRQKYAEEIATTIAAPPEARELIERYETARRTIAYQTIVLDEAANQLRDMIGSNRTMLVDDDWTVTWKSDATGAPDWKALAESLMAGPGTERDVLINAHRRVPNRPLKVAPTKRKP